MICETIFLAKFLNDSKALCPSNRLSTKSFVNACELLTTACCKSSSNTFAASSTVLVT